MPHALTWHATCRIAERQPSTDELARALAGTVYQQPNGRLVHYDRRHRWALVADPDTGNILTVFRLTKRDVKRLLNRVWRKIP